MKKQMRGKQEKSLGDGEKRPKHEAGVYPWPGLKSLEQERDPYSVQQKLWECPFGAGTEHDLNSVLLGSDFLNTAPSEMAWRFLCPLGSLILVTQ